MSATSLNGGAALAYDAAGDVIGDGLNSYLYDAEGRLCAVLNYVGALTGYVYDAGGTRVAKGPLASFSCNFAPSNFTTTTSWVLGPGGEQVTEYAVSGGAGAWVHTNVFTGGKPLATYRDTNTYFALTDWLGTKRVEVGASGCASAYASLAYGDGLTPVPLPGYSPCPDATEHHFTGKERDTESGNDYFGARYYASSMGRFMSPDWSAKEEPVPYAKLDDPQSLNLYAYVLNNPLTHVDPDGHDCHTFLGITVCFGKPAPLPPPPPTPKPPPVPPPPPVTFKPKVPAPDPNSGLGKLIQCTNSCLNPVPVTATSTSEKIPGHPEIHGPGTPHGKGEAWDFKTPGGAADARQGMMCSASCGAGYGKNEWANPSEHALGPGHDHAQTGPGLGGSRGDLPDVPQ